MRISLTLWLKANEVINKLTVSIDGAGGGQDFSYCWWKKHIWD